MINRLFGKTVDPQPGLNAHARVQHAMCVCVCVMCAQQHKYYCVLCVVRCVVLSCVSCARL